MASGRVPTIFFFFLSRKSALTAQTVVSMYASSWLHRPPTYSIGIPREHSDAARHRAPVSTRGALLGYTLTYALRSQTVVSDTTTQVSRSDIDLS